MADLPDPMTPADCDLRDFQFMPLDIVRLFGSEFHAVASDAAWRAGVTLWLKSFHQVPAASIPNDDLQLTRLAELGRDVKTWLKIKKQALHGWIECGDGRLYHPVVAEKANEAWQRKSIQRERSKKGNAARWGAGTHPAHESGSRKSVGEDAANVLQGANESQKDSQKECLNDSFKGSQRESFKDSLRDSQRDSFKDRKGQGQGQRQRQGQEEELKKDGDGGKFGADKSQKPPSAAGAAASPQPRGSRLDAGWELPKSWGDWALAEFPDWTPDTARLEAAKFADYWHAKAGKDGAKLDWLATWRNWCRNARPSVCAVTTNRQEALEIRNRAVADSWLREKAMVTA